MTVSTVAHTETLTGTHHLGITKLGNTTATLDNLVIRDEAA